jgi:hypothetical protein
VVSRLPEEVELNHYFQKAEWIGKAKRNAQGFLNGTLARLDRKRWNAAAVDKMFLMGETLKRSYE